MRNFITLLFTLLSFFAVCQSNLVEPDPIKEGVHQRNSGKITFMPTSIPIENYNESDFISTITLSKDASLYIRPFLANSLTNYLHLLFPSATAEELDKNGNFQFAFYVDGKLIYRENLHLGAFGLDNKNKATVFSVPLFSSKNEDSWGRFLWNRFMMKGGEDALSSGTHLLKIEIRPYVIIASEKVGDVIASGEITTVSTKEPKIISEADLLPSLIKDAEGWEKSDFPYQTEKIKELKAAILKESLKKITSVLVIKDGKILIEEYFNGASRKTLHNTRSVGKTFTSALTGIALSEGLLKSAEQPLSDFYDLKKFDNYSNKKANVTIKNLLTMSSAFEGFDFDSNSPGNEENMYPQKNWVAWTLNLPMASREPGSEWAYFTAGIVVLGDILDKHVPGRLEKYAAQKLFVPMGITKYKWQYTPQKVANTAGGLQLSSLSLAKFGQLYLNNGNWKGKQILPETWVAESHSKQMAVPTDSMNYGFLFWNKSYKGTNGPYESYFCSGNGGNKIHIFKELNTVVVITATAYGTPYMHIQADRIIESYILPALGF